MPPAVATPLPPLNLRVTGNMWPATAAMPSANAPPRPATARPTPLATAPLPKSATRTTSPAFHPISRATFDAPGLPDPSARTSWPPIRAISAALGKVPSR